MNTVTCAGLVLILAVTCHGGAYPYSSLLKQLSDSKKAVLSERSWSSPSPGGEGSGYEGSGYGNEESSEEGCEMRWPWALMEQAQFIGRCETSKMYFNHSGMTPPQQGVLFHGCPWAYQMTDRILGATREQRNYIEKLLESIFHIMQCANLVAEFENMQFFSYFANFDLSTNMYVMESTKLFETCEAVFGGVEEEMRRFEEGLQRILNEVYKREMKEQPLGMNNNALRNMVNEILKLRSKPTLH